MSYEIQKYCERILADDKPCGNTYLTSKFSSGISKYCPECRDELLKQKNYERRKLKRQLDKLKTKRKKHCLKCKVVEMPNTKDRKYCDTCKILVAKRKQKLTLTKKRKVRDEQQNATP